MDVQIENLHQLQGIVARPKALWYVTFVHVPADCTVYIVIYLTIYYTMCHTCTYRKAYVEENENYGGYNCVGLIQAPATITPLPSQLPDPTASQVPTRGRLPYSMTNKGVLRAVTKIVKDNTDLLRHEGNMGTTAGILTKESFFG